MPARVSFLMSDIKPRRLGLLHNGHLTVIRFWHGNLMSYACHAMARSSGRGQFKNTMVIFCKYPIYLMPFIEAEQIYDDNGFDRGWTIF